MIMHYLYIRSLLATATTTAGRGGRGTFLQANRTNFVFVGANFTNGCHIYTHFSLTTGTQLLSVQECQFGTTSAHHTIIPAYTYCSEVNMDDFFPFVYKREKKKEFEPEPLYIELYPPPPKREEKKEEDDSDPGVIIIQL
jgi:hypothetical protein